MASGLQVILRIIHKLEDTLLVSALLSMLIMAVIQIGLRNFFDSGIFWAESLLRILVLWIAILGGMIATRESNHISIDAISRFLAPPIRKVVMVFTNAFSALVCGVVAYHSFAFVHIEYLDQTIAFAEVPIWVCQGIIPFGFSVMSIRFVIIGITRITAKPF